MSPIHKAESERISLRFAGEVDRHKIFEWLVHSDLTPSMMGPPDFPDHPIPTWEEFNREYDESFFDNSTPEMGRFFIIVAGGEDVGVISYSRISPDRQLVEMDIWLRAEEFCGRGIGSSALIELCEYLRAHHGFIEFLARPSSRNQRAVAACRKAGFEEIQMTPAQQTKLYGAPDYEDAVVMIKVMDE